MVTSSAEGHTPIYLLVTIMTRLTASRQSGQAVSPLASGLRVVSAAQRARDLDSGWVHLMK
jgi:hypothetical protein